MIKCSIFCLLQIIYAINSISFKKYSGSTSQMLFSLRQSINIPAIKSLTHIFRNPKLCIPVIKISHLRNLDCKFLKESGIRAIVFDKDNTLSYTYCEELHESVIGKVKEVTEYFPSTVAILSNSIGSSDDRAYAGALAVERSIGLPVIRHKKKKPQCVDEVMEFLNMRCPGITPAEVCVVGDRVLTDVVFANQNKMLSVLVSPLSVLRDHPIATILRFVERSILLPLILFFSN